MNIREISCDDISGIASIAQLAHTIWHQHYTAIIGKKQVDYMLEHFQSASAIAGQLQTGYRYFLLEEAQQPIGYCAIQIHDSIGEMHLSKLYVSKHMRGKGAARRCLDFLTALGEQAGVSSIALTVNRNNSASIAAYQKLGFAIDGTQVADIGGGFVMDDYRMRMQIC